jgi:hypothetical protein
MSEAISGIEFTVARFRFVHPGYGPKDKRVEMPAKKHDNLPL